MSSGLANSSSVATHGPHGLNVSKLLPIEVLARAPGTCCTLLDVARADVVQDGDAGHIRPRFGFRDVRGAATDDQRHFAFVVDVVGRHARQHDRLAGANQRRGRLQEEVRFAVLLAAHLADVRRVRQPERPDLGRAQHWRQDPHLAQRQRLAVREPRQVSRVMPPSSAAPRSRMGELSSVTVSPSRVNQRQPRSVVIRRAIREQGSGPKPCLPLRSFPYGITDVLSGTASPAATPTDATVPNALPRRTLPIDTHVSTRCVPRTCVR